MTPRSLQPEAASDDDAHDPIDDAVAELARRRGAWLGDEIIAMTLIASLIEQAERFLPEMVTNARLNSRSWDEIARAIGTSPEEAHLRFDPECQFSADVSVSRSSCR